jgi:hypothetical protein
LKFVKETSEDAQISEGWFSTYLLEVAPAAPSARSLSNATNDLHPQSFLLADSLGHGFLSRKFTTANPPCHVHANEMALNAVDTIHCI